MRQLRFDGRRFAFLGAGAGTAPEEPGVLAMLLTKGFDATLIFLSDICRFSVD